MLAGDRLKGAEILDFRSGGPNPGESPRKENRGAINGLTDGTREDKNGTLMAHYAVSCPGDTLRLPKIGPVHDGGKSSEFRLRLAGAVRAAARSA